MQWQWPVYDVKIAQFHHIWDKYDFELHLSAPGMEPFKTTAKSEGAFWSNSHHLSEKSLLRVTSSYPRMNIFHKNWRFYARTETSVYWLLQDHSSNPILSLLFFQLAVFFRFPGLNLAWSHSGFLEGVILPFKFWNSSFFLFGKFLTLFTCNWEG